MRALYQQVCDQLLDQISLGQRRVGDRLPPETEFANEMGVSRSTIRMAFAELESSGVLSRRKRAGTQIISAKPQPKFNMATSSINELLCIGQDTEFRINTNSTVHTNEVDLLEGHYSETDHWLEISVSRTMSNESRPYGTKRVYVPARYAGIEPVLESSDLSVHHAIEEAFNVSVTRVSQKTTAIACPEADAGIIGLEVGAPALQISTELYAEDNLLMELSVAVFDPARYRQFSDVSVD